MNLKAENSNLGIAVRYVRLFSHTMILMIISNTKTSFAFLDRCVVLKYEISAWEARHSAVNNLQGPILEVGVQHEGSILCPHEPPDTRKVSSSSILVSMFLKISYKMPNSSFFTNLIKSTIETYLLTIQKLLKTKTS